MSNEDRLKVLGLTTLEEQRKRGDLIYMYKLTKSHESIQWENTPDKPQKAKKTTPSKRKFQYPK